MRITIVSIVLLLLAGCSNVNETHTDLITGNPAPEEFLQHDEADIFLLDGIVYSKVSHVDWVIETKYTIGEEICEITKQSSKAFSNGTANVLPVGTKIYETDAPFLIAVVDGQEIPYLAMLEG